MRRSPGLLCLSQLQSNAALQPCTSQVVTSVSDEIQDLKFKCCINDMNECCARGWEWRERRDVNVLRPAQFKMWRAAKTCKYSF